MNWQRSRYCSAATCVEIAFTDDAVHLRDSKQNNQAGQPVLTFTRTEWAAFLQDIPPDHAPQPGD